MCDLDQTSLFYFSLGGWIWVWSADLRWIGCQIEYQEAHLGDTQEWSAYSHCMEGDPARTVAMSLFSGTDDGS